MDKRWSVFLLVALCAALVGLLALQVVWFSKTIALRGSQFDQSVDNALFAVSERLEMQERIGRLRRHAGGQQLIQHLDSLNAQRTTGLQGLGTSPELTDADHEAIARHHGAQGTGAPALDGETHDAACRVAAMELRRVTQRPASSRRR